MEDSAKGWQYAWNATAGAYDLYVISDSTQDVLEYSLTSHTLGLGVLADFAVAPGFFLSIIASYAPVYISDEDDHKLRTKLSTSTGWGHGLYADLRAVLRLGRIGGVTPYLGLDGSVIYYVVETTQRQYWYGNADAANGAPQGTVVTGVGHVVTSAQLDIGLSMGFSF